MTILRFIMDECRSSNIAVTNIIKEVYKFLAWKLELKPESFTESDKLIVMGRQFDAFDILSNTSCYYTKDLVNEYTEFLWQTSLQNRLQQMGERRAPIVTTKPIPIQLGINRQTEVLLLSLFYKQNLLNAFLYLSQRSKCPSPLCTCQEEEQTAYHILVSCSLVDSGIRRVMDNLIKSHNDSGGEEVAADYISLLNCARDKLFLRNCTEVVNLIGLGLRTEYIVSY